MEPIPPIIRMLGPAESATLLGTSKSRNAEISVYQIESQTGAARIAVKNIRTDDEAVTESLQKEYTALKEVNAVLPGSMRDSVPHPLLLLENANTICLSLVAGTPLDRILRRNANVLTGWLNIRALEKTGYCVGEWLRCFHSATQRRDEKHNPSDYAFEFKRIVLKAKLINLSSGVLEHVQKETLRLNESLRDLSVPIAAKHGDFIPQNILLDEGNKLGVIDFASYRREAPIFYDLAHFLAYTTILATRSIYSRRALSAVSRNFLAGYSSELKRDLLRLYKILAILRIVSDGNPSGLGKQSRRRIQNLLVSTATRGGLDFSEGLR